MKQVILLVLIGALAGCGGVNKFNRDGGGRKAKRAPTTYSAPAPEAAKPFASGPISQACMASDRKARSRELCGCIQAVANQTLSGAQQRVAVGFYSDPHEAQEIRQSDRPAHEDFWKAYRNYGDTAERICG